MQDISTLQQRLREVAMPTTSEEKAGATPSDAGSMSGINKASRTVFLGIGLRCTIAPSGSANALHVTPAQK